MDEIDNLKIETLKNIFSSVAAGVNNHGSFLVNFSNAFICADSDNTQILLSAAYDIVRKYNLFRTEYLESGIE